jgi:protein-S-isoprenylcysteine O-methyltransferase Ste14
MWMLWAIYWWVASLGAKQSLRRESFGSRVSHVGPLIFAALLLGLPSMPIPILEIHLFSDAVSAFWIGAALTASGLLFTVWARLHLGANWSGAVTIKQDHTLISSGPYSYVRHPIYTGILLSFVGSAIARAEWRGVLAVVIVLWALWRKLNIEERWLSQEFGNAYADYRRRVAAIIPYVL